ncbi:MAG TPA: tetratricopeptide repeat protein [Vicinamibacterales bacterium]
MVSGRWANAACALVMIAALGWPSPAVANPESSALRAKAAFAMLNLDHDVALAMFRQAVAADPQDAAAYRGLATSLWLSITFRRGNMTVDDYLGRPNKPSTAQLPPPPQETITGFHEALDRATAIARAQIAADPRNADAHFQLGAAVGLKASYTATVEGSVMGAFRAAHEAYDEHEQVLSLAPERKDAGLIVGTYRYIVAALSMPLRMMAYMAGFGGGKEKGMALIEGAAAYGGDNQSDARFALILMYNREHRYDDALTQLRLLREKFPRNRLVWLETGSTSLRAGKAAEAERFLSEGMARFADDHRPRMYGEDALWSYKLGAARAALGKAAEATTELQQSIRLEGRKWVHGRSHFELGKLALKKGNKPAAASEFKDAIALCDEDNDPNTADEARRLLK